MAHRIREGMRELHPEGSSPLGGANKVVEVDESYVGGKARNRKSHVPSKEAVVALIERSGRVRSHHVADVTAKTLRPIPQGTTGQASDERRREGVSRWPSKNASVGVMRRATRTALVIWQSACLRLAVDGPGRASTVPALAESVAFPVHFQDVDVMCEPVQQGSGQPLGSECLGPFVEGQVAGDQPWHSHSGG